MKYLAITLTGALSLIFLLTYKKYREESVDVYSQQPYSYLNIASLPPPSVNETVNIKRNPEEPANVSLCNSHEKELIPSHLHRYVTFSCNNPGRLGNQGANLIQFSSPNSDKWQLILQFGTFLIIESTSLNMFWPLFSGWAIGQTLNRRLYLNCNDRIMEMMRHIVWMFPKVAGIFEIMKPEGEKMVPLAYANNQRTIHGYEDPKVHINRTEKYLRVDIFYAQNARFIYPYHKEIHRLLEFGGEITEKGEAIVTKRKINPNNVVCAHIRQSDFNMYQWTRTFEDCLATIQHVTKLKPNQTLMVMGDDQEFMKRMVDTLITSGDVGKDSFHSTYSRAEDMYLSRRLCKTFVLTSEGSTFGFWLAFVAGEHSNIYYLNEDRPKIPQFDSEFPFPWTPINVLNGTVVW